MPFLYRNFSCRTHFFLIGLDQLAIQAFHHGPSATGYPMESPRSPPPDFSRPHDIFTLKYAKNGIIRPEYCTFVPK